MSLSKQDSLPRPVSSALIVGGGLAGFACALALRQTGLEVTVFERSPELREVGAGIQLPPNATRLLRRWGILDELKKYAYAPEVGSLRSFRGAVVSRPPPGSVVERIYDAPYLVSHRADLLKVLHGAALQAGVEIRLGSEISTIDFPSASLRLSTGEVHSADFILGADGERSLCRGALIGGDDEPRSTGDVVYRIAVPRSDIVEGHPSWELMQRASVNVWMGPRSHAVSYLLRDSILNVVLVHEDESGSDEVMYGPQSTDLDRLKNVFSGWDPALQSLLQVREADCTQWSLLEINEPTQWVDESGRFSLVGDAAHAVLPYLAQGAAQAFEDAGMLGAICSQLVDVTQVPEALRCFEEARKPRTARVRQLTLAQKAIYGLPDGPHQQQRDAKLQLGGSDDIMDWLWRYDAYAEGSKTWRNRGNDVTTQV